MGDDDRQMMLIAAALSRPPPPVVLFYTKESPFSNFYPCEFQMVVGGISRTFHSSEQAFMALKAMEFNDPEHLDEILRATTPFKAKQLGRKVRNFDDDRWCSVRQERMIQVLFAKFSSSEELRDTLINTNDSILAEASPRDRTWGIGIGATNPGAKDRNKWTGKNLLGHCLMAVRAQLVGDLAGLKDVVPSTNPTSKRARVVEDEEEAV